MFISSPHDQAHHEVQPIQGVPWVQEAHAHQRNQKVLVCQALPIWHDKENNESYTMNDA